MLIQVCAFSRLGAAEIHTLLSVLHGGSGWRRLLGVRRTPVMMLDQDEYDWTIWQRIRHIFRERELYVRSDGNLRFVVVRSWALVAGSIACCGLAVWIIFATTSFVLKESTISAANSRTQSVRVAYEDRIASIQSLIDSMNDKLLLDQDAYLGQVDTLRSEFAQLLRRHRRLEIFFEQGWLPTDASSGDDASDSSDEDEIDVDQPERQGWWSSGSEDDFRTAEEAERPLNEVRIIFAELLVEQHALLDRVVDFAENRAHEMRTQFRRLGLDPIEVAASIDALPNAVGGPLLPVQQGEEPQDGVDERILEAHRRFNQVEKLRYAVTRMPITLPIVEGYQLTSGFGFRQDPFTDVMAMHAGTDLRAAEGTPVVAPADGRVTRAEHADAYGKVIDIEHDNGITTRYAHLSRIDVAEGDRIETGQQIGLVGSTGRSTGPHLHYETRVDGRPVDAYNFIRVARDVLQEEN